MDEGRAFGSRLTVLPNCIIESFGNDAELIVGDNCFFSYGVILSITMKIELRKHVWIGEYTSLRDATHQFKTNKVLGELNDKHAPILIGNNVWIGKGCIILLGTVIDDNVIVAANSSVKGELHSNAMYGGCPARLIKKL